MLSKTLDDGLGDYAIGAKVRDLRHRKGLNLVRLGEHTGLSAALLSKIERSQIYPTLPTLLRIAMVFGVGLDYFFSDDRNKPMIALVKKEDRLRLPAHDNQKEPAYFFESLDFTASNRKMMSYLVHFNDKESEVHSHDGAEIIYVVSGALRVTIADEEFDLEQGDCLYFDSGLSHTYRGKPDLSNTAFVVVTA